LNTPFYKEGRTSTDLASSDSTSNDREKARTKKTSVGGLQSKLPGSCLPPTSSAPDGWYEADEVQVSHDPNMSKRARAKQEKKWKRFTRSFSMGSVLKNQEVRHDDPSSSSGNSSPPSTVREGTANIIIFFLFSF